MSLQFASSRWLEQCTGLVDETLIASTATYNVSFYTSGALDIVARSKMLRTSTNTTRRPAGRSARRFVTITVTPTVLVFRPGERISVRFKNKGTPTAGKTNHGKSSPNFPKPNFPKPTNNMAIADCAAESGEAIEVKVATGETYTNSAQWDYSSKALDAGGCRLGCLIMPQTVTHLA